MKIDKQQLDELFMDEPDPADEELKNALISGEDEDASFSEEDEAPYGTEVMLNKSEITATIFDWIGSLFLALIVVLLLMTFGFRIIDVDGRSMEPTLIDTDKVVITNLFYTPHNGDIVIISHAEKYPKPLVKRVIATEGQQLDIDFTTGEVKVDGKVLEEPYIQGFTVAGDMADDSTFSCVIPENKVFVMGDNRGVSLDSRYSKIGFIDEELIIGKAQLDVIPHTLDDKGNPKLDFSKIRYIYK